MEKRKLTVLEFYQKYYKHLDKGQLVEPAIRQRDEEFFKMVEKAQTEGKQLMICKSRPRDWDGYLGSLVSVALKLTEKNKVFLLSQHPQSFVDDLKKFFKIEVDIAPSYRTPHFKLTYDKFGEPIGIDIPDKIQTGFIISLKN